MPRTQLTVEIERLDGIDPHAAKPDNNATSSGEGVMTRATSKITCTKNRFEIQGHHRRLRRGLIVMPPIANTINVRRPKK